MDRNDSADTIKIELGKEGPFLSSRSRAREIINKIKFSQTISFEIELDFKDVESCTQSFISELIVNLKGKGILSGRIKAKSIDQRLETRLKTELNRLEMA